MDPEIDRILSNHAEEYFKAKFRPIADVYMDLEVLQDFRLFALLALINTKAEYDYIRYRLKEYSKRMTYDVMKYFPSIKGITDADLDAYIADKSHHRSIALASPTTKFYSGIPNMITHINESNSRCPQSVGQVVFHIGTNSVILDQDLKDNIRRQFQLVDKNLGVTIYNRPLAEFEPELVATMDMVIIENLKQFTHNPITRKYLSDGVFFNKQLLAYPYLETEPIKGETEAHLLNNTKVLLEVYCDFDYIERTITI